jgi:hypothetical protein
MRAIVRCVLGRITPPDRTQTGCELVPMRRCNKQTRPEGGETLLFWSGARVSAANQLAGAANHRPESRPHAAHVVGIPSLGAILLPNGTGISTTVALSRAAGNAGQRCFAETPFRVAARSRAPFAEGSCWPMSIKQYCQTIMPPVRRSNAPPTSGRPPEGPERRALTVPSTATTCKA